MRLVLIAALFLASQLAAAASIPNPELANRDRFISAQKIIRLSAMVKIDKAGQAPRTVGILVERSPSLIHKVAILDMQADTTLAVMQAHPDGRTHLVVGKEASDPPAPWFPATLVLGQAMEPQMAFNWLLGLPGLDPSIAPEVPEVILDEEGRIKTLHQGKWTIQYLSWAKPVGNDPPWPEKILMSAPGVGIAVILVDFHAYTKAPDGYQE